MSGVLSSKFHTARKQYYCENCRIHIEPGQRYQRVTFVMDGDLLEDMNHETCNAAIKDNYDFLDADDGYIFLFDYLTDERSETDDVNQVWNNLTEKHPAVAKRLLKHLLIQKRFPPTKVGEA